MDILDISLAVKNAEQKLVKEGKIGMASVAEKQFSVTVTLAPNEELGNLNACIIEGTCEVEPTDLSASLYWYSDNNIRHRVDTAKIKGVVSGSVWLGNRNLLGEENDSEHLNDSPFLVIIDFNNNATLFIDRHPREMKFEISREYEEIKPIDQKYIPPMDSITLNGADGNKYKLTVDENGALAVNPA